MVWCCGITHATITMVIGHGVGVLGLGAHRTVGRAFSFVCGVWVR